MERWSPAKVQKEKKHKEEDNCICNKRQKLGAIIPYDDMEPGSQRKLESVCRKFVVAGSKAVDKTWSKFLSNSVARKKACIEEALNVVFESKKGAKVMQHKIRKNKKQMSIDILTKTREWVQRKLHEIGRNKKKELDDTKSIIENIPLSSILKVSPLKIKSHSHSDANARRYLKAQVPFLPTVDEYPDLFHVKHGFVNPEKLLIAIMSVAFVTPELHKHWYWFFKKDKHGSWFQQEDTVKVALFNDGFAYQNGTEPAVVNAFQLMNLPALTHIPAFSHLQAMLNCLEGSECCLLFYELLEDLMLHLCHGGTGVNLSFDGYDESLTLPKSNTKLAGTHTFFLECCGKGDIKGKFLKSGAKSCNQQYVPDVKMDSEERTHPDKPVTWKNWLSLATKHADYVKIQKFVKKQKDKFEKEKAKVQNLNIWML